MYQDQYNDLKKEILELKRLVVSLMEREVVGSIEEISLNKAVKKLHMGQEKILEAVRNKELAAMPYKDSKGKIRYRFKVSDINDYQRNRAHRKLQYTAPEIKVEKAEDIFKRAFKK